MNARSEPVVPPRAKADLAGLTRSFGLASMVVLIGVASAWFVVKRAADAPVQLDDGDLLVDVGQRSQRTGIEMLLEQAEVAYAAGRILEPRFDSALYFYQSVLAEAPGHQAANRGVDRVVEWLRAELAAARETGEAVREVALLAQIAELLPEDASAEREAAAVRERHQAWQRFERAISANDVAAAVEPYRVLGEIEGAEALTEAARERVLARLVSRARTAANQGDLDAARAAVALAETWGLAERDRAELSAVIAGAERHDGDQSLETTLVAAVDALESGRLLGGDSAWRLFQDVLAEHPGHAGARAGVLEVRAALVQRIRAAIAANEFELLPTLFADAERIGVDADQRASLQREVEYREHLAAMRVGRFGDPFLVSELEVIDQQAPVYPRAAVARGIEGWVDLEFTVSAMGRVEDVRVVDSSAALFHQASIDAIEGYRFAPFLLHGRPVPVRAALRFNYRM